MWKAVPSMAAKSSSCAVVVRRQPKRHAAQFGVDEHSAIAIVPGEPEQTGLARAVVLEAFREFGDGGSGAACDGFEDIAGSGESGLDAGVTGMDGTGDHTADAGDQAGLIADGHDAGGGADHVDHIADANAGADGVPMRVEGADRDRDAGAQAEFLRPCGGEVSGDLIAGGVASAELFADAGEGGIERREKFFGRETAEGGAPHPFVAHGADAARYLGGIADAAEDGGDHVAMFERGGEARTFGRVVAQPVEEFGEAPFAGVDAAAPIDGGQLLLVCGRGDLGGFPPGAMVAPKVVIVDGLHVRIDRDYAGAGGIECDGFDRVAINTGILDGAAGGERQRGHVVGMALGGVVGIFLLAQEGIVGGTCA